MGQAQRDAPNHSPWWKGARGEWYVAAQVVLFALVVFGPRTLPGWPQWAAPLSAIGHLLGIALMFAGTALTLGGVVKLGSNLTPLPYPKDCANLVESGPYAIVRNPIYSGLILDSLGWAFWVNGWLTIVYALLLFAFFDVKSRLEERWLTEKYGAPYADYRTRVRKLIPWVY